MKKRVAWAIATVTVAATTLGVAMRPAAAGHYYGSDFIAGNAMGFAGAFILTNPCYPCNCGCYRTYPHYYFHHFRFPDRLYHSRNDYRS